MKTETRQSSRYNKRLTRFITVLALVFYCSFFLFSCVSTTTIGNQEDQIDEGDMVRIVDDKIIKLQSAGISVTSTKENKLRLYRVAKRQNITPLQMLIIGIYLIVFYTDNATKEGQDNLIVELYDMQSAENSTEFTPVRTLRVPGEFMDSRLYNGEALVFSTHIKKPSKGFLYLQDSILGKSRIKRLVAPFEGTGMFRLDFMNPTGKIEVGFFDKCEKVYYGTDAIYPIKRASFKLGCNTKYEDQLSKISYKNFMTLAIGVKDKFIIQSRRHVYERNNYVFVLCNYNVAYSKNSLKLMVYDSNLIKVGELAGIDGNSPSMYFEDNYLYVNSAKGIGKRIDISDPTNLKSTEYEDTRISFNSVVAFGEGRIIEVLKVYSQTAYNQTIKNAQITLYDTTGDKVKVLFQQKLDAAYLRNSVNPRKIITDPETGIFAYTIDGANGVSDAVVLRITDDGASVLTTLTHTTAQESNNVPKEMQSIVRFANIDGYLYAISEGFVSRCNKTDYATEEILSTYV